jgi:hypothetical protein
MRRTLEFGWSRGKWWMQHAVSHAGTPGHVGEGLRAYAIEQSNAERQRSIQWATKWSAVRGRARAVMNALMSPSGELLMETLPNLVIEIRGDDKSDLEGDIDDDGEDEVV